MQQACYLILDQGGQSSRALIINSHGDTLACESVPVATRHPAEDQVEQDAEALVASLLDVARQAVASLPGEQVKNLVAAGLVTQRSSLLCWQAKTFEPLTPVISWQDRRAHAWLEQLNIEPHWFRRHTGLYPNAHYGASKINWCLNNLPDVSQAFVSGALCCGPLATYLAARLTGSHQPLLDPANAQRTGLYNIEQGSWDADLLRLFDIPEKILPTLVKTISSYGLIPLGGKNVPLRLVNGDQSAAIFAHGEPQLDSAYINAGTGAFVTAPWEGDHYPEQLLKSIVYKDVESHYVVEGTVNGAGSALNWAAEQLQLQNLEELDHWARVCEHVPIFINAVGGLGAPYWRADMVSEFIDVENGRIWSDQQKMVAVLESIVFLLQTNLQLMQAYGFRPQRLVVSGGLSQLDNFCQKLADLSRIPVWRPDQVEASACGAAFLLALHSRPKELGKLNWKTLGGAAFAPSETGHEVLNQRFHNWREALQTRLSLG